MTRKALAGIRKTLCAMSYVREDVASSLPGVLYPRYVARQNAAVPLLAVAGGVRLCYNNRVGFEWDINKAASNLVKHGVSFDEAESAVEDPFAIIFSDPDHSHEEDRVVVIGVSNRNRMIVASCTERGINTRIISARLADRAEKKLYENA